MALSGYFEASYKFNDTSKLIRTSSLSGTYTETHPTLLTIEAHPARARIRMPGG